MSGMGGLTSRSNIISKIILVNIYLYLQHSLLRETPKALITTFSWKLEKRNTVNYCSLVIILRIYGQSAGLPSKFDMIEYDGVSTTERIWVSNDGLINQKRLKIQSSPCVYPINTKNISKERVFRSILQLEYLHIFIPHTFLFLLLLIDYFQ